MKLDYDAMSIGAGHKGLTSASLHAQNGLKVLCLDKTDHLGGMAVKKELLWVMNTI